MLEDALLCSARLVGDRQFWNVPSVGEIQAAQAAAAAAAAEVEAQEKKLKGMSGEVLTTDESRLAVLKQQAKEKADAVKELAALSKNPKEPIKVLKQSDDLDWTPMKGTDGGKKITCMSSLEFARIVNADGQDEYEKNLDGSDVYKNDEEYEAAKAEVNSIEGEGFEEAFETLSQNKKRFESNKEIKRARELQRQQGPVVLAFVKNQAAAIKQKVEDFLGKIAQVTKADDSAIALLKKDLNDNLGFWDLEDGYQKLFGKMLQTSKITNSESKEEFEAWANCGAKGETDNRGQKKKPCENANLRRAADVDGTTLGEHSKPST